MEPTTPPNHPFVSADPPARKSSGPSLVLVLKEGEPKTVAIPADVLLQRMHDQTRNMGRLVSQRHAEINFRGARWGFEDEPPPRFVMRIDGTTVLAVFRNHEAEAWSILFNQHSTVGRAMVALATCDDAWNVTPSFDPIRAAANALNFIRMAWTQGTITHGLEYSDKRVLPARSGNAVPDERTPGAHRVVTRVGQYAPSYPDFDPPADAD